MKNSILVLLAVLLWVPAAVLAATSDDVSEQEKQIAELDKKIEALRSQKEQVAGEAAQTEKAVAELQNQLEAAQLELQKTKLTIDKVADEQEETSKTITDLQGDIVTQREHLASLLRLLYEQEQQSFIRIFLTTLSFSEVLAQNEIIEQLQEQVTEIAQAMRARVSELEKHEKTLEDKQENLTQLQNVLDAQEEEVAQQEKEQATVLQEQKAQEATYAAQLAAAKQAREEIANKVFTLKSSNVEVSLTTANDMALFASKATGVRAALLLAVLKVESNLGNNVGGGRYPDDMQPQSREAFVRITDKLGLDRATTPVSRKPASGKGWGGAMGPAQIMPATWEGIEGRVGQILGRSPVNPYELSDAVVATGIFLADRGASAGKEREALARYLAGPYWEYHVNGWYVDRVLAVAVEYDKELAQ